MAKTVHLCENPACTLGAVGHPGRFTGGITAEGKHLLTGAPLESLKEGADYGDGFCPNCATKSTKTAPSPAEEHQAHIDAEIKRLQGMKGKAG